MAIEEYSTANALKIGEAAVVAEQERQAHAQEMAITLSAHSAETERVKKVHSLSPSSIMCFIYSIVMHICSCMHQK
jgi:hypothetical protein